MSNAFAIAFSGIVAAFCIIAISRRNTLLDPDKAEMKQWIVATHRGDCKKCRRMKGGAQ